MSNIVIYGLNRASDESIIDCAYISLLSADDIRAMAHIDIQSPIGSNEKGIIGSKYRLMWTPIPCNDAQTGKPMKLKKQLIHPLMGSTDFSKRCSICNENNSTCIGNLGCSTLPCPIQHVSFAKRLLKILSVTCFFCSGILYKHLDEMSIVPDAYPGQCEQWYRFWSKLPKLDGKKVKHISCPSCGLINPVFSVSKDIVNYVWPAECYRDDYRPSVKTMLHFAQRWRNVLEQYPDIMTTLQAQYESFNEPAENAIYNLPSNDAINLTIIYLLSLPLSELSLDAKWILRSIAFIHPIYRNALIRQPITSAKLFAMLDDISDENHFKMGLDPKLNRASSLVWSVLPIAPNSLRPRVSEASGSRMKSDDSMTKQYTAILSASAKCRYMKMKMCIEAKTRIESICSTTAEFAAMQVLPEQVFTVFNETDPWIMSDLRALWFNFTPDFLQSITELQHQISWLVDAKASLDNRGSSAGGSNKVGAKNAGDTASSSALAMESGEALADDMANSASKKSPSPARTLSSAVPLNLDDSSDTDVLKDCIGFIFEYANDESHLENCTAGALVLYRSIANESHAWVHPTLFSPMSTDAIMEGLGALRSASRTVVPKKLCIPNPKVSQYTTRKAKQQSIADKQSGKDGSWRGVGRVKRSDNTSRGVITPDAFIGVNQVGIPNKTCLTQTVPVIVNSFNKSLLQSMVARGSGVIDGAFAIVTSERRIIHLQPNTGRSTDSSATTFLRNGWMVYVYIQDGTYLIVNRQPTLHRPSHLALRSKSRSGKATILHEIVLPGFGGDCDGDAVCKSFPQSIDAIAEACMLMCMPCNMICPRTHRPIASLHQDSLLGVYLLTQSDTWLNQSEAMTILSSIACITPLRQRRMVYHGYTPDRDRFQDDLFTSFASPNDKISMVMFAKCEEDRVWQLPTPDGVMADGVTPAWSGRQLFSVILPSDLEFVRLCGKMVTLDAIISEDQKMKDNAGRYVCFHRGKWLSGNGSKEIFGVSQNNLVHYVWRYYGKQYAADLLSDWSAMGHTYLLIRGFSCAVTDVMLGGEMPSDRDVVNRLIYKVEHSLDRQSVENISRDDINRYISWTTKNIDDLEHRFQRACLVEKENAWSFMDDMYHSVQRQLIEDASELTVADVRDARYASQKKIDRMVINMGNFTASMTDEKQNSVSIMKNSGTKGSNANSTTMAACMPLDRIGGTHLIGSGIHPRTRILPNEVHGLVTPDAIGAIRHGFVEGITPAEMIKHSMATWDKVYRAAKPEQSGYQYRRVSALCENAVVHYDGTVRTGPCNIVQLAYGGDGYDAMKTHQIKLHSHVLRPVVGKTIWTSIGIKHIPSCLSKSLHASPLVNWCYDHWSGWFGCDGCSNCVKAVEEQRQLAMLLASDRCNRHFFDDKTMDEILDSGIIVYLNIHAHEITRLHCAQWTHDFGDRVLSVLHDMGVHTVADAEMRVQDITSTFAPMVVSHDEWVAQVANLCDCIVKVFESMTIPIDLMIHLRHVLHLQSMDFSFLLASKQQLQNLMNDLYRKYVEHMAEPGTAVGIMAAQSIGEPNTQMTMKAHKQEMSDAKHMKHIATGADEMENYLTNRIQKDGALTTVYFNPSWVRSLEDANAMSESMIERYLNYYVQSSACFWIETFAPSNDIENACYAQHLPGTHPLCPSILNAVSWSYMEEINGTAVEMPPRVAFCMFQIAHIRVPLTVSGRISMERMFQQSLLPFQRGCVIGGASIHDMCPYYWVVWHIEKDELAGSGVSFTNQLKEMTNLSSLMMTDLKMGGIDNVSSVVEVTPPSTMLSASQVRLAERGYVQILPRHCFKVVFDCMPGSFLQILAHRATMDTYCTTNHLREMEQVFGDIVRPKMTNFGIDTLISSDGSTYVQPRHTMLACDVMSSDGFGAPANRNGLAQKTDTHAMTLMAFEDTPSVIMDSAFKGKVDPMIQNVASVIAGNPNRFVGTGIVDVLPPPKKDTIDSMIQRNVSSYHDMLVDYIDTF